MKILFINTHDIGMGGGIRAVQRIREGLKSSGVECPLLVQQKWGRSADVYGPEANRWRGKLASFRYTLDGLPLYYYPARQRTPFCSQWFPSRAHKWVQDINPNVIFLEVVTEGFLNLDSLQKFRRPIVWNLCDSWAFTGGCHFPGTCRRYQQACGQCPILGSKRERDLSRWVWHRKQKALVDIQVVFVAPSAFMAEQARNSSLLAGHRISIIPNPLDSVIYRPLNRQWARDLLGLPGERPIILFGAANPFGDYRKGYDLLDQALARVKSREQFKQALLVIFGADRYQHHPASVCEMRLMDYLYDDYSLAALYSAADVMVVPSRHEPFGQTISEAMACGIPVVAFDVEGPASILDHQLNGYLARPYEPDDLAHGIQWILEDSARYHRLSLAAREKAVSVFSLPVVSAQYEALFNELTQSGPRPRSHADSSLAGASRMELP